MKMTKPKPVSRMKRPFISELAELGLSGEILSIRTDGMQGTLIPDLTAGVSEAGRVKTGNWVISDKRTFDHVVLCVERQDENHDVYVGKFIQLHVAANKSLKIVEMGDVKLVAITSSIPTTFNGGIKRYKGLRMCHFPKQLKPLSTSRSVSTKRARNVLLSPVLTKVLSPGMLG